METTSRYDVGLTEVHRRYRRAADFWKHPPPVCAWCDNPAKDGPGLVAAVWAGDGKPELLFPGRSILVETVQQCNDACAYLLKFTELGFDVSAAGLEPTSVPPFCPGS